MNIQRSMIAPAVALLLLAVAPNRVSAQLPPDFPGFVVSNYNAAATSPGCVFLAVAADLSPAVGNYLMIITNDGTVVWHHKLDVHEIYDFKMAANGHLLSAPFIEKHSWTGGGDAVHEVRDASGALRETITGKNGYVAESHDFQLLPNGNVLQFGYYMSEVDMSVLVPGGHPAARVAGGVVQELDANRNVVFQWRTWDTYSFSNYFLAFQTDSRAKGAVVDAFHLNTIDLDVDGHLLLATPQWVRKLSRQTGEILWTIGGSENQFTFASGGASGDFGGHNFSRLPSGHVLIYDNGGRGTTGAPSKVHEYQLDEVNKIATRVWTYTSSPAIKAWHRGSAQRLANGNTFIGWGGASGASIPTCTEVTPAGEKVFEIWFTNAAVESYRAFRFDWPPTNKTEHTELELATGNTYEFTGTGVTLEVLSGGGGYNEFTVIREPYAPVFAPGEPAFFTTAPRVLPVRVKMREVSVPSVSARISFDVASLGISQPSAVTVYYRTQAGQGSFVAQATDYNPVTQQLRTTIQLDSSAGDCGEFIFGIADLPHQTFAPILNDVENHRGVQTHEVIAPKRALPGVTNLVNQQQPVALSWSPKGFAKWYELQIASDAQFVSVVTHVPYQTEAFFLWSNGLPSTVYHYRVRTHNDAGAGDWSTGAFQLVPPAVQVTAPNGGEAWQRGQKYFIRWQDNLTENVIIDLYRGGAFLRSLDTNSSAGGFQWEAGLDLTLAPGSDYSIRIRSATDPAVFDTSDLPFGLDVPTIDSPSMLRLSDGRIQFGLKVGAGVATQARVFGTTNLSASPVVWEELKTVPLTGGNGVFVDDTATNFPTRIYRVFAE